MLTRQTTVAVVALGAAVASVLVFLKPSLDAAPQRTPPATLSATAPPNLSWSLTAGASSGLPYFHCANAGTDCSGVAARLGGAAGGVSDTRELAITLSRRADSRYSNDVADLVAGLYASVTGPLLDPRGTVVVGSAHRAAVHAAETLHAQYLPGQTLAFADSVQQACNATAGGDNLVLTGCDYDYDGLWLWIKPARVSGVPGAHIAALRNASSLMVLRATTEGSFVGKYACPGGGWLAIHSSIPELAPSHPKLRALWGVIEPRVARNASRSDGTTLRQWEWGLPDATVAAYVAAWGALGRSNASVTILEGEVVPGFLGVTPLWETYLDTNGVAPRGVQIESYWVAQTSLARRDGSLPIPTYAFWKPDFFPSYTLAVATLEAIVNRTSPAMVGQHTRAFINTVGSTTDPEGVEKLFGGQGLPRSTWGSVGLDCPPTVCHSLAGETVAEPHAYAATLLAAKAGALLPPRVWRPLAPKQVVKAFSPQWRPPAPAAPARENATVSAADSINEGHESS